MNADVQAFRCFAGAEQFKAWLEAERATAIKYLTNAVEPHMVHRAQGKVQLLDTQLELLEKAKNLR